MQKRTAFWRCVLTRYTNSLLRDFGKQVASVAAQVRGQHAAQVLVSGFGGFAAAGRALDVAFLDEEGLIHFFDGFAFLAASRGDGADAHRATLELVDDGGENALVHVVEAAGVHVESLQSKLRDFNGNSTVAFNLGEVAGAAQQVVGNAGRAARAAGNFVGRVLVNGRTQDFGRALHDGGQQLGVVVLQARGDTEAGPQRRREHTRAGGGANEGERRQRNLHRAGVRTRVEHDVDAVVFHRRIEVLFHYRVEAVDFVDEEHIMRFEVGEQAGQVRRLVEHRA